MDFTIFLLSQKAIDLLSFLLLGDIYHIETCLLPLFGNLMPYLRRMILKELIQKYEFDDIVPDLLTIDEPVQDNLYAFKEAFDELRRMAPGNDGGKQIVVSEEIETDDDGNETERYLHATNCEGDFWEASLAKEVVIQAEVTEIRALAQILWHVTFYGFMPGDEEYRPDTQKNKYERMAAILEYHQFCNYARIKRKKNPTDWDLLCPLSMEKWDIYHAREAHRNRAKRMRDARQNRQIANIEHLGRIQRLIDSIDATDRHTNDADYNYLFEQREIRDYLFYSRTTALETRAQYIADNITKYFHEDLTQYAFNDIILSFSDGYKVSKEELKTLCGAIFPLMGRCLNADGRTIVCSNLNTPQFRVKYAIHNSLGHDIRIRIISSR